MNNFLNLLIVFLLFMFCALLWHQLFRMPSEESMVCSAILIMLGGFLTALFGRAWYIYFVLMAGSISGIVAFVLDYSFIRQKKRAITARIADFLSPSVVAFCLLFAYAAVAFKGAVFTYPDEIAQWGPAVKYMATTGHLPYGEGFSGDAVTLTTATMFQYIWTGLVPFIERNTFLGNFLLAAVPAYLPLSGATWKDWKKVFLYTLMFFLSINVLTYVKYYTLIQDIVLPMWAGGIIAWLLWKPTRKINWGLFLGALACIGAMKSMVGPLFSGIIMLVLLIRQWYVCNPKTWKDIVNLKTGLLAGLTVISALLLCLIWSALISQNVYNRFGGYSLQQKNIFEIIRGTFNNAFYTVTSAPPFPAMSYVILFAFVIIAVCVMRKRFADEREGKQFTIVFSLYAVGFLLYLGVMIFAYLTVFGQEDSELVAGLNRYLSYYTLLGLLPLVSLLFMEKRMKEPGRMIKLRILVLVALLLGTGYAGSTFLSKITALNIQTDSVYKKREELQELKEELVELTDEDGKIFVLGNLISDESKLLSWELGEERYRWNQDCYMMYVRNPETATVRCDIITYPEFLEDYDYLWCYEMGEEDYTAAQYRFHLSELREGAFYRIEKEGDKLETKYLGNLKEMWNKKQEEKEK